MNKIILLTISFVIINPYSSSDWENIIKDFRRGRVAYRRIKWEEKARDHIWESRIHPHLYDDKINRGLAGDIEDLINTPDMWVSLTSGILCGIVFTSVKNKTVRYITPATLSTASLIFLETIENDDLIKIPIPSKIILQGIGFGIGYISTVMLQYYLNKKSQ